MVQSVDLQREIEQFLYREAELLDGGEFDEWLGLLAEDLAYDMPQRITRERNHPSDSTSAMGFMKETRWTLEIRVRRLKTEYAWAEDPPSRTRRFVSNVRIESTSNPDEINVRSYFLLYKNRGSSPQLEPLSGERRDLLRKEGGTWKLARRVIRIDQATLGFKSLSIFL